MIKIVKENKFLISWIMSILLVFGVFSLGIIKETRAGFGNVTGQLTGPKNIKYVSNYPNDLGLEEEIQTFQQSKIKYILLENSFVLDGYEFVNWNTSADGSGDVYSVGSEYKLEKDIIFYAQWKKIEVKIISYGDTNIDGVIDDDDYFLIEKYVAEGIFLDEQSETNADVNKDGKIDLIDVDIVKQVCLGTSGYVGILPNNPIYVYEIYQGNNSLEDDENNTDSSDNGDVNVDNEDTSDDNTSNGDSSNNGSGTLGTGSGSGGSGSGGTSNKPSGGNNKPSNDKNENKEDNKVDSNVSDNINEEDKVDDIVIQNTKEKKKSSYAGIIVFVICLLSLRLIIYVLDRFRKKDVKDSDEESKN